MLYIQNDVAEYMNSLKFKYWTTKQILTQLDSEGGEFSGELLKQHGPKKKQGVDRAKELGYELSDVLFALACFSNVHKLDMEDAFFEAKASYSSNGRGLVQTLNDLRNKGGTIGIDDRDPFALNQQFIIARGKFAEGVKILEKKEPVNITYRLGDMLVSICMLSYVQEIDLDAAWKEKLDIRYGRDKGRFEQKP